MGTLVYGMNQSLDGYVNHDRFAPGPTLFRHFIEEARAQTASIYGRRIYEIMSYWDHDDPSWDDDEREFADAYRRQPKWVASRTLTSVAGDARLIEGDLGSAVSRLKAELDGEIAVAGPGVAGSLTTLGLIDEYRIYLHPVVLGQGDPFFTTARPRLRLISVDRIDDDVLRLRYVPSEGAITIQTHSGGAS